MIRRLALVALAAPLLTGFAPAPKPKEGDDAKALQGEWKIVRVEYAGKPERDGGGVIKVFIKGDRLEFEESYPDGYRVRAMTFVLGPKKPKEITLSALLRPEDSPYYPGTFPGIYKLEKDTLTICYSTGRRGVRPKEFKTAPGGSENLFVFQRVKP